MIGEIIKLVQADEWRGVSLRGKIKLNAIGRMYTHILKDYNNGRKNKIHN
jgi:hypothetical protein